MWFHGRALAATLDVDPAVPAWFAFLHDSQRHNDGWDPEHGARAADFAVRLRQQCVINELDGPALERLCEAMRLHSAGHTTGDATVLSCWKPTGWTWHGWASGRIRIACVRLMPAKNG